MTSRWSNTRCPRGRWRRRCTGTTARTSTATCSRDGWAALLGDEVVEAGPGDLVFKPRNEWHTFWNAGEEPCRILEIIAPAGFEHFFEELVDMGGVAQGRPEEMAALCGRYELRHAAGDRPGAARALRPAHRRAGGDGALHLAPSPQIAASRETPA